MPPRLQPMPDRCSTHRRRAARFACLAAVWTALSGCEMPTAPISPQRQTTLENRAMALLQRAGRHEADVVRANAIEALADVDPESGLLIFRTALTSQEPLVRYAGCRALGEMRDRRSRNALRKLMRDPDARVQLAAAWAAYRCGVRSAGALLVKRLNHGRSENIRAEAAYLIGKLDDRSAMSRLRLADARESSGYVAVHIAIGRALLGEARAREQLVEYVLKSDAVTVLLALQGLAEVGDRSTRKALEYRLFNEADYLQTRLLAARALGRIGSDRGYALALAALRHVDKDNNEQMRIRANAALALGAIGDARALAALESLAETDNDPRTQVAACYAICQILNKRSAGARR